MIDFARIWAFALLPLPLVAWFILPALISRNAITVPPGVWQILNDVQARGGGALPFLGRGMVPRVTGWICLVLALAGPQTPEEPLLQPTGRDVMMAIDLSASMGEAQERSDGTKSRQIDFVGPFVTEFLSGRSGDRVGLIAFGSDAYLVSPLTFDTSAVSGMFGEVSIGLPGRRTDLGQAIGLTVQVMRNLEDGERILVMISDGETNIGELAAMDAAGLAAANGITIYMIGFSAAITPENAEHMTEVAELTGGQYFEATDPETLQQVRLSIDAALPITVTGEDLNLTRSWAWLPALFAVIMAMWVGRQELAGA